ncbi:cysteine-rich receptor-like protein kinase 15 [Henckelia pumila]|uniref:cysteine-rich receptor-like protein kinase 15 n=1 Tax=Henckelia pumila TaxID=405737 RepID=UPI003C6DC27E
MISQRRPLAVGFLIAMNLVNLEITRAQIVNECLNNGNYSSNSTYKSNLQTLFSSLPTNIDINGFYNASLGQNPDTVYASVLCRGDVQLDICRDCIQETANELVKSCPNSKQSAMWNEFCMLRYSNESMFGILAEYPGYCMHNTLNVSSPRHFLADVNALLHNISIQAADGGSLRKVAAGNKSTVDVDTLFSLVQCTPEDCSCCLCSAFLHISPCCYGKIGCRILFHSCIIRYEIVPFYNETRLQELQGHLIITPLPPSLSPATLPLPLPGKKDGNRTRTNIIIVIVVSIVVSLIAAVWAGILLIKRTKTKPEEEVRSVGDINMADFLQYDFHQIKIATDDFSDANKLGQGGFGSVYKGKLLNGLEIAVKRMSFDSSHGHVEFKNEVLLVAKVQHRNLVRLLGFSMEGDERLLVYEFVQNASLERFIFDPIKRNDLDWERRYKIIVGIAKGLLYLHEESRLKIIHRDLKASNILLDEDMNPKIADFGMAKLFAGDETHGSTNRIVGAYTYMPPEYALHGQFSVKSDVFSFGVLILEILAGQRNNSFQYGENVEDLLSVARKYWCQGTIQDLIDPVLRASLGFSRDMLRCIHFGLLCAQENPADRPTMTSIVLMLSNFTIFLPGPSQPTFFRYTNIFLDISNFFRYLYGKQTYKNYFIRHWIGSSNGRVMVKKMGSQKRWLWEEEDVHLSAKYIF